MRSVLSSRRFILLMSVVLMLTVSALGVFAQTPVALAIDTNEIFTQTNFWIDIFIPVLAIGFGIAIAITLITFVGKSIVNGIRGSV